MELEGMTECGSLRLGMGIDEDIVLLFFSCARYNRIEEAQ